MRVAADEARMINSDPVLIIASDDYAARARVSHLANSSSIVRIFVGNASFENPEYCLFFGRALLVAWSAVT